MDIPKGAEIIGTGVQRLEYGLIDAEGTEDDTGATWFACIRFRAAPGCQIHDMFRTFSKLDRSTPDPYYPEDEARQWLNNKLKVAIDPVGYALLIPADQTILYLASEDDETHDGWTAVHAKAAIFDTFEEAAARAASLDMEVIASDTPLGEGGEWDAMVEKVYSLAEFHSREDTW